MLKYGQGTVPQDTRNMVRPGFNSPFTVIWSQYQNDLSRNEVDSASKMRHKESEIVSKGVAAALILALASTIYYYFSCMIASNGLVECA